MKKKPAGTPDSWVWGDETETGQSTGGTGGTAVVFDNEFSSNPRISITPWKDCNTWITAVSTIGFSWESEEDDTTIDWIAHNG